MVLADVIVLTRVMVLADVIVLTRVMVLACVRPLLFWCYSVHAFVATAALGARSQSRCWVLDGGSLPSLLGCQNLFLRHKIEKRLRAV